MITREQFRAVLHGGSNEVFSWTMSFFNEKLAEKLLGKGVHSLGCDPGKEEFTYGASPKPDWEVKARFGGKGRSARGAGRLGRGALFRPWRTQGEFRGKEYRDHENKRVTVYETGCIKK